MKLVHTSDWHVGKAMRGRSRADEHEAVLAEVAGIADDEAADLVLVVGDLFETAAPAPEAERIVYRALLALAAGGARPVVVVSGNHDNARRLAAVAPVLAEAGVVVQTALARPDDGGVLGLEVAGVPVRVALVPFLSQRYVVSAADLMGHDAAEHGQQYADRVGRILAALARGFDPGAVNLVAAHLMVVGGMLGGGERPAQTIFEYGVPATAFPADAHYVALGHLHRRQRIDGPCPLWYCGSPLQLDFGEGGEAKAVNVVEAEPGTPAQVREVALTAGRSLRTVRGSLAEVVARAEDLGDDYLRVVLTDPWRAGLADEVRESLAGAVDVRVDAPAAESTADVEPRLDGQSPRDLFAAYLEQSGADDPRVLALFDELVEEAAHEDGGPGWAEEQVDAP